MPTYIMNEGAVVPNSVYSGMNTVLNKKLGTSQVYKPQDWADLVKNLVPLPEKTASGSIAHFSDGADTVPFKSSKFYITPQQASGTPTPSNPLPIAGRTGANVTHVGANIYNPNAEIVPHSTYGFFNLCPDNTELSIELFDKDNTVSLSGISFGFSKGMTENGAQSEVNVGYNWIVQGGTDTGSRTNIRVVTCDQFFFYPKTQATLDTINARYYINIVVGSTVPTTYEAYNGTTYPVSWSEHGTIYGGYFKDGELWATYKLADLSIMDWDSGAPNQDGYIRFVNHSAWGDKANGYRLFCDKFPVKTSLIPSSPTTIGVSGYSSNANIYIAVESSMLTGDLSTNAGRNTAFRDWISDNGLQILYELATPVKVADLDPLELVSFLGVNNVWCDSGDCEVEYRADPTLATQ